MDKTTLEALVRTLDTTGLDVDVVEEDLPNGEARLLVRACFPASNPRLYTKAELLCSDVARRLHLETGLRSSWNGSMASVSVRV